MLEMLKLTKVGPVDLLEWDLSPRLNIITGDNGLGKTFLLECAWWALTETWARKYPVYPHPDSPKDPSPSITFRAGKSKKGNSARYIWEKQIWKETRQRELNENLGSCQSDCQ